MQRSLGLRQQIEAPGQPRPARQAPAPVRQAPIDLDERRAHRSAERGLSAARVAERADAGERAGDNAVGTVLFFDKHKGYGFVSRPDGTDLFVHYSNVQGPGRRALEAGQKVEFEVASGQRGDEARKVKVV